MCKKWFAVVLSLVMVLGMRMNAAAAEICTPTEGIVISEGVYEGNILLDVAERLGYDLETEDGYKLSRIDVSLNFSDQDYTVSNLPAVTVYALGDYIGNVKKEASDIYFPNDPIASNWYDGPLSKLSKTYSRTVSPMYSCTASVSSDVLNAGLSFSITESVTESTTWERPAITSSQKINVKEFGVYDKYGFTLYSMFGKEKGTGKAYKPMGLYVTQATYSK